MLYRSRVIAELLVRGEEFVAFEENLRDEVRETAACLRALASEGAARVRETVSSSQARVSYPSTEMDARRSVAVPFGIFWRSHEEARSWAASVLRERVTFAADGSQIYPGREVSLPVAAVQIATFENPHLSDGSYAKEAHFKVIAPQELRTDRVYDSPEQTVNARRFELEAAEIIKFLERMRGWRERGERAPVAFLDNTLLFSPFRKGVEVTFSKRQAEAAQALVAASRETRVPVVGYVDHSYAPDIRHMLETFYREMPETNVYDAQILRAGAGGVDKKPLLAAWGDRTIFWHCRRTSLAESFYDEGGNPLVGFVYLQTTGDANPARVECPAWIYEEGLLEEVLDAVRAECVVGNGYPYALETADAAAVMTARDREQFLRVMEDFANERRLSFRVSRKASSKARRR